MSQEGNFFPGNQGIHGLFIDIHCYSLANLQLLKSPDGVARRAKELMLCPNSMQLNAMPGGKVRTEQVCSTLSHKNGDLTDQNGHLMEIEWEI